MLFSFAKDIMYSVREKSLISGYQRINEPLSFPASLMVFQTIESKDTLSILSFVSLLPPFSQYSPAKNSARFLLSCK